MTMNLYHWKSQGIDFLLMAKSEDEARKTLLSKVQQWRQQDPARFELVSQDLKQPPYFVAGALHVVAIDSGT